MYCIPPDSDLGSQQVGYLGLLVIVTLALSCLSTSIFKQQDGALGIVLFAP
jgi:hypothetical protein